MKAVTTAVHVSGKKFVILDYLVPDTVGTVNPGWGVICPLRGKEQMGIVLSVYDAENDSELKELVEVLQKGPVVPGELIELAFWIADTYMVELGQAVSLIFPPFARGNWSETFELKAGKEQLSALLTFKPEAKSLVDYILTKKNFGKSTLELKFGKELTAVCLKWLLDKGYITAAREYRHERQERLQGNMVRLSLIDHEEFIKNNKRAKKQVAVIEALMQHQGDYPMDALLETTGTSREILRILENKQAVQVYRAFHPWDQQARKEVILNREQRACLEAVTGQLQLKEFKTFLLHGVTGSGKTEVYVRAAEYAVSQGSKVIVIVPEIALSSQLIRYFQRSFAHRAVVLHSKLASLERYQTWQTILNGDVDVVIGTRSAVFAPFDRVGLIIVDEEHDRSLKQDSTPRYHSIGVAAQRCRKNGGVLLLGSATPSMESFFRAKKGEIQKLKMTQRIGAEPPLIKIVDMREELRQGNNTIFSRQAEKALQDRLNKGEQAIVFLNRRGYASFVSCRSCGFVFRCSHCDISLTYHARYNTLKCHYCGFRSQLPPVCPECGSTRIKAFGLGTEKVEKTLQRIFPQARILRLDSDSAAKPGAHEKILGAVARGECDFLIGTQMVTKGFDFPGVTLVCVVAADMDLNLPDFRSEERTFQLLTQVAGRAGRRDTQGEVIIQSYNPDSPGIAFIAQDRQEDFYAFELNRREALNYPPFSRIVRILFSGIREADVLRTAENVAVKLAEAGISFLGPAPAPLERIKDSYRWHLIVRDFEPDITKSLSAILKGEKNSFANNVKITIDVDPLSLM